MSRNPSRALFFGLVSFALVVPLGGCDSSGGHEKATIDLSTPIKAPGAPGAGTTQKVEVKAKKR
jgi:hypothetical protein